MMIKLSPLWTLQVPGMYCWMPCPPQVSKCLIPEDGNKVDKA